MRGKERSTQLREGTVPGYPGRSTVCLPLYFKFDLASCVFVGLLIGLWRAQTRD